MAEFFLGRQPVFDRKRRVVGYELLFRSEKDKTRAVVSDPDRATASLVIGATTLLDFDDLVGSRTAFFNVTRLFLADELYAALPARRVVLEIPATMPPDARLQHDIRRAREAGYGIAVDRFVLDVDMPRFLGDATMAKIAVDGMGREDLAMHVRYLKSKGIRAAALRVETQEQFASCMTAGFDYFQGYFFCAPELRRQRDLPAYRATLLALLAELHSSSANLGRIHELAQHDATVAYRILRLVNSSNYALARRVLSVRHAAALLGVVKLRNLATLLVIESAKRAPRELMMTALVRAQMCRLLAQSAGYSDTESFFTVGLLSVLDAVMGRPMAEALKLLPLARELVDALVNEIGPMGLALAVARAGERGHWHVAGNRLFRRPRIVAAYQEALRWAMSAHDRIVAAAAQSPV